MDPPRWLADEMLGRLSRYLRFCGQDVEYARGLSDEEIRQRAQAERRTLLTRDRLLAARTPGAVLLRTVQVGAQLREVQGAVPGLLWKVRFERCSICNGVLEPWSPPPGEPWPPEVPHPKGVDPPDAVVVYACRKCGHRYWEGSHTARIRRDLGNWLGTEGSA